KSPRTAGETSRKTAETGAGGWGILSLAPAAVPVPEPLSAPAPSRLVSPPVGPRRALRLVDGFGAAFVPADEDLIKYGWPEDIWFHVDKLSSAHVYLRLHKGQTVEDIPKEVLIDCAHLVKANSIQGCKMNNVNVVYTPWTNLKKTADMDVGQIGFHRQKDVKMLMVEKKVNEILNRLEKTKVERFPDLAAEKEARDREERNEKKAQIQEMKRKEKEEMKKKKELEELRSYSSLMKAENMSSNQDGNDSDDFM
uniref:Coiled-coil domain-containing protein 25 n=1 Tax=Anser brachyrhynchus TaxID=132585 RepID=A0A8B9BG59_9AVES